MRSSNELCQLLDFLCCRIFCASSTVVCRTCSRPHLLSTLCPEAQELGQRSLAALPGISQLGNLLAPNRSGGEDAIWVLLEVSHAGKSHFAGYKQHPFPQHNSFMEGCYFLWYTAVSRQFYTFNCAIPELQLLNSFLPFLFVPLLAQHFCISQKLEFLLGSFPVSVSLCMRCSPWCSSGFLESRCSSKWNKSDLAAALPFASYF